MSEVRFPLWATVLIAIWAAIGPLVGIVIGHLLVRSWERRRWLADNTKEEYRRVLSAVEKLNGIMTERHVWGLLDQQELKETTEEIQMAVNPCLFIRDFLEKSKVIDDILVAVKKFNNGGSVEDYRKEYWKAIESILASAKKSAL